MQNIFVINKLPHFIPAPATVRKIWTDTIKGFQQPKGLDEMRRHVKEAGVAYFPSLDEESSILAQIKEVLQLCKRYLNQLTPCYA